MKKIIIFAILAIASIVNAQDVISVNPVQAFNLVAVNGATASFNDEVNIKSIAGLPSEARLVIVTLEATCGQSGVTQAGISLWNDYRPFGDSSLYRCLIYNNIGTVLTSQRQFIIELNSDGTIHIQAGLSGAGAKSASLFVTGYIK